MTTYSFNTIRTLTMRQGLALYSPRVGLAKSHIERILKNPFYVGSFIWNGTLYPGKHTPLISQELFDRVQHVMGNRRKSKHRKQTFAYSGLLTCGKCGCLVTAEVKKGRYVYYHCTKSRTPCDELYYREEQLTPQFDGIVQGISIDPAIKDWLVRELQDRHADADLYHQQRIAQLEGELKRITHRLEQLYLDKLDGKVAERFWLEKSAAWQAEQDNILNELRRHKPANPTYLDDGSNLLELASKAYHLYAKQNSEQKNNFLKILLSNCTLRDGTISPTYKKPFDILAQGTQSRNWGE